MRAWFVLNLLFTFQAYSEPASFPPIYVHTVLQEGPVGGRVEWREGRFVLLYRVNGDTKDRVVELSDGDLEDIRTLSGLHPVKSQRSVLRDGEHTQGSVVGIWLSVGRGGIRRHSAGDRNILDNRRTPIIGGVRVRFGGVERESFPRANNDAVMGSVAIGPNGQFTPTERFRDIEVFAPNRQSPRLDDSGPTVEQAISRVRTRDLSLFRFAADLGLNHGGLIPVVPVGSVQHENGTLVVVIPIDKVGAYLRNELATDSFFLLPPVLLRHLSDTKWKESLSNYQSLLAAGRTPREIFVAFRVTEFVPLTFGNVIPGASHTVGEQFNHVVRFHATARSSDSLCGPGAQAIGF